MKPLFSILVLLFLPSLALAESWGLMLGKEGEGAGRVCVVYDETGECQVDDGGNETNVTLGEFVYLKATPEPGSRFVRWVGQCRGTQRTCRMLTEKPPGEQPISATALFVLAPKKGRVSKATATPIPPDQPFYPAKGSSSRTYSSGKSYPKSLAPKSKKPAKKPTKKLLKKAPKKTV